MCCISRIKPEYQSSVMALKNKVQLWDPTGRSALQYVLNVYDQVSKIKYKVYKNKVKLRELTVSSVVISFNDAQAT